MKRGFKLLFILAITIGLYIPNKMLAAANDIDLHNMDEKTVEKDPYYVIGRSVILKDGSRYHVVKDSLKDDPYMTLLSDYNVTAAGTQDAACSMKECRPMSFDTNGSTDYQGSHIEQFVTNTYFNAVKNGLVTNGGNVEGLRVSLPDTSVLLEAFGSPIGEQSGYSNLDQAQNASWLLTTNYWTKTKSKNNTVYYIDGNQKKLTGGVVTVNDIIGVRPILVTLKTNDVAYSPRVASFEITGENGNYEVIAKDQDGNLLSVAVEWSVDEEAKQNGVTITEGKIEFEQSYKKPITIQAKLENEDVTAKTTYLKEKSEKKTVSFLPFIIIIASLGLLGMGGFYFYKRYK